MGVLRLERTYGTLYYRNKQRNGSFYAYGYRIASRMNFSELMRNIIFYGHIGFFGYKFKTTSMGVQERVKVLEKKFKQMKNGMKDCSVDLYNIHIHRKHDRCGNLRFATLYGLENPDQGFSFCEMKPLPFYKQELVLKLLDLDSRNKTCFAMYKDRRGYKPDYNGDKYLGACCMHWDHVLCQYN